MPRLMKAPPDELPDRLRPFAYHGLHFSAPHNGEATADCPFCGAESKLSINTETGLGRCFKCAEGSDKGGINIHSFLKRILEFSEAATTDYGELVSDRKLIDPQVLAEWRVCKSITTREWIIPGYNSDGVQNTLYRYVTVDGKRRFLPTPTLGHGLFGVNLYDKKKTIVDLCEGPWDGMAWYEILSMGKPNGNGGFAATANREASLLSQRNVLAVPGCETFNESWLPLFSGKVVNIMFDNDHPRTNENTGKQLAPAGLRGVYKMARMLSEAHEPPKQINYMKWGEATFKLNDEIDLIGIDYDLPSGHDLRDELSRLPNLTGEAPYA